MLRKKQRLSWSFSKRGCWHSREDRRAGLARTEPRGRRPRRPRSNAFRTQPPPTSLRPHLQHPAALTGPLMRGPGRLLQGPAGGASQATRRPDKTRGGAMGRVFTPRYGFRAEAIAAASKGGRAAPTDAALGAGRPVSAGVFSGLLKG